MSVIKDQRLFNAFVRFSQAHIASGDIDPMYPVLRQVYDDLKLFEEQRLWRTVLYVATYHIGSAWKLAALFPTPTALLNAQAGSMPNLPTGTERRCFRGRPDALELHLRSVAAQHPLLGWVNACGDGEEGWRRTREAFQTLPFGGPWSSYKWADLLACVHTRPITADDLGVGGGSESAGPIPGMVKLTGRPWKACATEKPLQRALLDECRFAGIPFKGLDQLETSLCDFNSLTKGRYYVGHDIDEQMEKLKDAPIEFWRARSKVFEKRYLGEVMGWQGVRKHLNKRFVDDGVEVV